MTAFIKSNAEHLQLDTGDSTKEIQLNAGAEGTVATVDKTGIKDGTGKSFRTIDNLLTNGNFDIWQRADSHNSNGIGSADRWGIQSNIVSNDLLRSYFLLGAAPFLVPNANQNYARLYTGAGGISTSYSYISQKIPYVRQFDSKTLKGTFWAKSNISGQKCSISWNVYTDSAYAGDSYLEFTLTDEWAEYEYSFDIYSLSGKGDVTNNSVDDYLELKFWFDVGSNYATEGGGIGNQEGSLSLSNVTAYCVDTVNKDIDYEVNLRSWEDEFLKCLRYYEHSYEPQNNPGDITGVGCKVGVAARSMGIGFWFTSVEFKHIKRESNGICTIYSPLSGTTGFMSHVDDRAVDTLYVSSSNFMVQYNDAASGTDGQFYRFHWSIDAEFTN